MSSLLFGDIVKLSTNPQEDKDAIGCLSADGSLFEHCRLLSARQASSSREAEFKVLPCRQYYAQAELLRCIEEGCNARKLESCNSAFEAEHQYNDRTASLRSGDVVCYGQVVQLQHVSTGKFVCRCEDGTVAVVRDGSEQSWLQILPELLLRGQGSAVERGDQVLLEFTAPVMGNAAMAMEEEDGQTLLQVSSSDLVSVVAPLSGLGSTPWRVNIWCPFRPGTATLRYGAVVQLFQPENGGYLSWDSGRALLQARTGGSGAEAEAEAAEVRLKCAELDDLGGDIDCFWQICTNAAAEEEGMEAGGAGGGSRGNSTPKDGAGDDSGRLMWSSPRGLRLLHVARSVPSPSLSLSHTLVSSRLFSSRLVPPRSTTCNVCGS